MEAQQFLDYLNEHTTTRDLATEVAELLAARRERHVAVATDNTGATRAATRIAS